LISRLNHWGLDNEEEYHSLAPFPEGAVKKTAEDLLPYQVMTEDHPSSPLVLVGLQGELEKPDLSKV